MTLLFAARAAAALLAALAAASAAAQTAVEIEIDGQTLRFTPQDDRGDFHSPAGFVQANACGRNSALPHFEVCFRPDRNSARREAVFEYGALRAEKAEARDLGPYRARIHDGERLLAEIEVPAHYWFSRWRWQSKPRPVWRDAAALRAARLVPPFDPALARGSPKPVRYRGPMDAAGVTKGMGTTGERCDIGLVTCHQAAWLLGDRTALASVLAQGEAAGSAPWHFRDERTGAPVRFDRPDTARLTTHSNISGPTRVWTTKAGGWQVDTSHQPALAFLPWAITGDPYYLEELQFQHAYNVIWTPAARGKRFGDAAPADPILLDQVRGVAWSTRTLAQLAATVPERTPRWLLPRSYYERASRENAAALAWRAKNALGQAAAFHQLPSGGGKLAPWQNDMLLAATSYALLLGREEYREFRDWLIEGARARLGRASGWPRQAPTFYYASIAGRAGWAELWPEVAASGKVSLPADPDSLAKLDRAYLNYLRGALALAILTGGEDAKPEHDWLLAALRRGPGVIPKWAIAPGPALAGERRAR